MVYHGPSKGCRMCRKRRVKCDQGKPACNNCKKRKVECPGYDNTFDYRHRDETATTIVRAQQRDEAPNRNAVTQNFWTERTSATPELVYDADSPYSTTSASLEEKALMVAGVDWPQPKMSFNFPLFDKTKMLAPDPGSIVLNWYFDNYPMKRVDPQATHGFISLLKPLYLSAPEDSPLKPAVAAVATNLLMLFSHQGSDTDLARKFYAQSILKMKEVITDPARSRQDDLLLATLTLNFYDMINLRWSHDPASFQNHRNGAMALLTHRNLYNVQSEVSKHVTSCMRTAVCFWALDSGLDPSPEVMEWISEPSIPTNKACEIDVITFKFIEFRKRFNDFYKLRSELPDQMEGTLPETLIAEGLTVDDLFASWVKTCPSHWHPLHASADEILPSVREASVYGDRCAVYWDLSICDAWDVYRNRRFTLLRMIRQLCLDNPQARSSVPLSTIEDTMQTLIDGRLESLAFMLGDVVGPLRHTALYEINYPSASNGICKYPNPDHDHPRAAAASGGWLASTMLVTLAESAFPEGVLAKFPMRKGQYNWILGQLSRMQSVFLLSQPTKRANWNSMKRC